MRQKMLTAARYVRVWLASPFAWWLVLGLFVLEAVWLALSAQYPMAFDENYHFGLIKLHAQQWLPYFTAQPQNASAFGAVVRDPSYLYHWLMSFPYRLVSLATHSQTAQIVVLRLLNVALFAGALVLYRRIVRRIGVSNSLSAGVFAVFILVPVVPFLAAHINYDNLFFLAVPITVLLAFRFMDDVQAGVVNIRTLAFLLATLFLASLIKYPFLPIFAAVGGYLLWYAWHQKMLARKGLRALLHSWAILGWLQRAGLVLLVFVSFGLFAERYAANAITYHDPAPACDVVISQDECEQYGPYGRDRDDMQQKPDTFHANVFVYAWDWLYGMWYRLFFAINYDYSNDPPLLMISLVGVLLAVVVVMSTALRFRWLFAGRPLRQLVLMVTLLYILTLFVDGFSAYKRTGQPVAINGRYLIPLLPFIGAFGGLAWADLLRKGWLRAYRPLLAGVVIAVFLLQGGGAMTFIVRSRDYWFWNNGTVRTINRTVRDVVSPTIIGKGIY